MDREIMQKIFPEMVARRDQGLCPGCGAEIDGFRDELSLKEYRITGMCQSCQDSVEAMLESGIVE